MVGALELEIDLPKEWSRTPIRDTSCCCHPLTDVLYLRPGPRRAGGDGSIGPHRVPIQSDLHRLQPSHRPSLCGSPRTTHLLSG